MLRQRLLIGHAPYTGLSWENVGVSNHVMSQPSIYFLTNKKRKVLYIGCTDNLKKRIYHHKHRLISGFTKKYNLDHLVYFEYLESTEEARERERYLKGKARDKKNALVSSKNPNWEDLSEQLI